MAAISTIAPAACELFPFPSEKDSNFKVLSVGTMFIKIDVDQSTFPLGALPNNSFLRYTMYVVDISVAQNPHFHDNWQAPRR